MKQTDTIINTDNERRSSLLFLRKHQYKIFSISLLSLMVIIISIICIIVFTRSLAISKTTFTTQTYISNKTRPLMTKTTSTKQTNIISNQNIAADPISQSILFVQVSNETQSLMATSISTEQTDIMCTENLVSDIISQPIPLLIMTFNIQFYSTSKKTESIAQFIMKLKPDVVCLQENYQASDWNSLSLSPLNVTSEYFLAAECQGQLLSNSVHLSNTIYVQKKHRDFTKTLSSVDLQVTHETIRCAAVIQLYDTKIANLHLCGGRFDDKEYKQLQDHKHLQLKLLIMKHNPDIIVGDFNNENSVDAIMKQLHNYPFYQHLDVTSKGQFVNYFTSGVRYLRDHTDYIPAYNETMIGQTSLYGGTPDWIYVKNQSRLTGKVNKHDAISTKLSDHNAVTVEYLFSNQGN